MAKVTMTGLLSTFGEPRVLLEIIEEPGKGGGTPTRPPPMREGERQGPIEVLAIDVVKNTVRLRNSGVETNVTFEVAKSTPTPGGPGVPGAAPFKPPVMAMPQSAQAPQASAPTVISPNGANGGGGGVTLMGGGAPTVTPSGAGVATATAGLPTPLGADSGMRTIPSRPLRTENNGALPPMTKEQADLLMEVNALRGGPPAPPTSLRPLIQAAEQEHLQQQQNPAYPRLPYRGGPPPVPGRQ
jgi:hypothetical protein